LFAWDSMMLRRSASRKFELELIVI